MSPQGGYAVYLTAAVEPGRALTRTSTRIVCILRILKVLQRTTIVMGCDGGCFAHEGEDTHKVILYILLNGVLFLAF